MLTADSAGSVHQRAADLQKANTAIVKEGDPFGLTNRCCATGVRHTFVGSMTFNLARNLPRHLPMTNQRGRNEGSGTAPAWPGQAPIRVLLAEDDQDIREALVAVLEADGCDVQAAINGSELLERLGSWLLEEGSKPPADIIITDVRMPGFNGLSIVDGLRAYGWPLPVIIISAFADDEMRTKIDNIRSAVLMEKPLDIERLKPTMLRLIGREEN